MNDQHVDVLIVGAGLSGIGAACHVRRDCPGKTVAILEARDAIGGTWDLFRYPGIRSDSDMFTLGYSFKPWTSGKSIADGPAILDYVRETAREYGVDRVIRFGHRVVRAEWSSATARWTVTSTVGDSGETTTLTASFLSVCSGYYRYDEGFTPEFPGRDDFAGQLVHPQHWPEDLDHAGKRVVVIGSGATAVTLLPAMVRDDATAAEHVTMLQRSPTYISAVPSRDKLADRLRNRLPQQLAYGIVRWKNMLTGVGIYQLSKRRPEFVKGFLKKKAAEKLPTDFDVETHLSPSYDPWDQRLCATPGGELWRAIRAGKADIVTDAIDRFTATGILLRSGRELPADIIVTATGLNLLVIGGMELVVDGEQIDVSDTVAYKGMMLSGVPNFALTVGYTNASWTLKADLVARYVCRLLKHMDKRGYDTVTPQRPATFGDADLAPLIDLQAGYVLRSAGQLPKQGPAAPWRLHQNYLRDVGLMRHGSLTDDVTFGRAATPVAAPVATG
ncbi:Predicted flavoprotein CzcO associated with the cation diffusion facilitator CzcD [Jatrophihabitans endophyticus]|uniref:FAD-containing monooxygenase EthA n=1 Tax=Jatrophihabitans endophyticus TaxID=1206085 RepID=A0A1M5PDX4_9ACTN|nr:NAD(P)/FAD-dependent oxidoreductase [Jatrophihabitans endophyticus]SHG99971.1 Predicted flavoprotein CzcO associated with the cation diffusion facilitator CzcD [Jatrophihabitans endophyticus]